ncbi:enhancer of polycomb, putative [Ixodes scapularis]|uniref:Enhancer of polycomb-like protein n=1 Tax=Ixodes scapularis TaxID=6945 RepID=B7PNN4_IXOSC|nr:enhancer of polycomb, putative [Ixodes scapularis]|eukprot:XP_002400865.1 enhancer of polycomb, putative [Ixodes scapularis]
MDQDIPDYDMDSEDEKWLNQQAKKMEIHHNQFEEMMDRLEKGSGQQVSVQPLFQPRLDALFVSVVTKWLVVTLHETVSQ